MAGRVIRLGPGECSDIETGARFFAVLAFPEVAEEQKRLDAVRAWVGAYLHEANRIDECNVPFKDARLNEFVELPAKWCRAKTRTTMRRLRNRGEAARAVRPWILEIMGVPQRPVDGIRKFSQRQIALHLCDNDPERAANFQKRVWRPSRPVIHIAAAYDQLLPWPSEQSTTVAVYLSSAKPIEILVSWANQLQLSIAADPRFGINPNEQVNMIWAK